MPTMKSIIETEEMREDEEQCHNGYLSAETEDKHLLGTGSSTSMITPGLGVTTGGKKKGKKDQDDFVSFGTFDRLRREPSVRSAHRRSLNVVFGVLLVLCLLLLSGIVGLIYFQRVYVPAKKAKTLKNAIQAHAEGARKRVEMCRGIDWQTACDKLSGAGARRNLQSVDEPASSPYTEFEELILNSDDPTITYDQFCLRVYRLKMFGHITFPYYSSQLLRSGGNQTMALFIQHGAMRNSEEYFCSFKKLMYEQNYRDFDDILVIAPDFNYELDALVHPNDAFWNSSKPWGDWRVGAESDPDCCGKTGDTVSSFDVLDHMLTMLTSKKLFPNMQKIAYVGHSAGGQMVQRYAVMSTLAALWDFDEDTDVTFIIANPSSYTYLDNRRWHYSCGDCTCTALNCTCDAACSSTPFKSLGHPNSGGAGKYFPCYDHKYDQWPYGLGSFSDHSGRRIPYALRQGYLGAERAVRIYPKLHVVYLVGQNDTCNDGLPVCDESCWKREKYTDNEWPCFRNEMDTRCPAMLQGPFRRARGHEYMRYLEDVYGKPVHALYEIPGVGHNASGMFGSPIGLRELFGHGASNNV